MYYTLIDHGDTIKTGELQPIITPHGHTIHEAKAYFDGLSDYERPAVIFDIDGERITVELKITKKGYSGGLVTHGYKHGVNFNRVMNRRTRWGLTVWREAMTPVPPVSGGQKGTQAAAV